jgi:hypothetical protein
VCVCMYVCMYVWHLCNLRLQSLLSGELVSISHKCVCVCSTDIYVYTHICMCTHIYAYIYQHTSARSSTEPHLRKQMLLPYACYNRQTDRQTDGQLQKITYTDKYMYIYMNALTCISANGLLQLPCVKLLLHTVKYCAPAACMPTHYVQQDRSLPF